MEIENNLQHEKFIVYCTTCKINGKIYIGVHKTKNPDVFDGYIGNGIKVGYSLKNPKTAFQYALKKYGYNNFYRTVLFIFNTEEEAYNKEEEIVTLDFIKRRDNYNTCLGGKSSGTVYDSLYQYDLNGNFIREFYSVEMATKYFKCCLGRFRMAIQDKRSAFNSYWSKTYYEHLDITGYRTSKHSEIYQYDSEGNLIQIFNSNKEAADALDTTLTSLTDARSHKKMLKGYYFLSADTNVYDIIKRNTEVYSISDKSVSKYKNKILIKTYPSLSQAAKENNIKTSDIKKSIKLQDGNWSYGYSNVYKNNTQPIPVKVNQYDLEGNLIKTWNSISQCRKEFPKMKEVIAGRRNHTNGYTFKYVLS